MADDDKGLLDKLQDKAAKEVAKRTVERTANRLLDGLEEFLLGKKGAAEEILEQEQQRGSALDRVREQYGIDPDDDADSESSGPSPREMERQRRRREEELRKERALEELAAIKARRADQHDAEPQAPDPAPDEAPRRFDATGDDQAPTPKKRSRTKRKL